MRILFLNATASFQGGIEANVHATAGALRARGYAVALAHTARAVDPDFAAPFESSVAVRTARGLADLVRRWAPDLLYVHKVEDLSRLRPWALPIPTVRMVHDHDLYCQRRHRYPLGSLTICTRPASVLGCLRCGGFVERDRRSPIGLGWRSINARLRDLDATRRIDRVLVASAAMALELARNRVPAALVRVVPLGIPDTPAQEASPPGRYSLPSAAGEPARVLFVGQILRTKGLDLLLRAMAGSPPTWTLAVVGGGAQAEEFRALSRSLGLEGRVRWQGPQPAAEVARALATSDLLALPSRWPEPFGLVGLEAMRAARPVVAFAMGGVPDWLRDGESGVLVAPDDVAALGRAIDRLAGDTALRQKMGARGRALFLERYTMESYVDRLCASFDELLADRERRPCA